jgi:predicted PurR-regulated permease PerM
MEPTELCENRADTGQNLKAAPAPAPWPMFTRVAVSGMFVLAALYTLYFAKPVLLPIALAMLMAWVLRPLVRSLETLRIPRGVAAAAVVGGLVGALASGVYLLAEPATKWAEDAPQKLRQVERKASTLKRSIATLQRATDKIDEITRTDSTDTPPAPAPERRPLSSSLLSTTQAVVVSGMTTVILLYFLLASGDLFLRKMVRAIPTLSDKKKALEIARGVETEIGRYLFTVSIINFVLGVAVTLLMYFLDMPNPLLWGTMAALLNFIPYVGATISLSVLTMVSILTFETLGEALAVPAGYLVLTVLEGQIAYPLIVGRHFSVNPVLIFVSLLFWGWLWGIPGMLMAVPLLVIVKIICSHIESLAVVKELLEA